MALKDISWGAVIVGAVAVTAFVAAAMTSGGFMGVELAALETGIGKGAALAGAAVVGGVAGEFVSDLLKRGRDACSTLLAPRR